VTAGSLIIGNDTPAWDELAISIPAAGVRNVLGIDNGETPPSWKTALDGTNPANIANSASPGTSLVFAHRDHVHAHPAGLTATLHHTKYTGGEAILAVQGEATLDLEGDVTIAEGKGFSVGGSAVADSINITTSDTDDPYLAFITTKADGGSTPHEFRITLDQSGGHCHLEVGGQTANHDSIFCIKCVTGRTATLQVESDAGWGRLNMGTGGSMNLANTVEDGDIRFTVDDGGVDKYLYLDGATFTLLSSTGLIDLGASNLNVGGNITVDGTVDGVDIAARDHAKYTDLEAIAAIEGEASLALDGAITEIHGDANFTLSIVASNPRLTVDANDYFHFVRASNYFEWVIGSTQALYLNATGVIIDRGQYVAALQIKNTVGSAGNHSPNLVFITKNATSWWMRGTDAALEFIDSGGSDIEFKILTTGVYVKNALEIDGALNHDGSTIGFFGTTPAVQAAAYTPSNVTAVRTYDANATTIHALADVLGTLIADLQTYGLLQ